MRSTSPIPWPDRISGFRSGVINAIIDALDSLRPIASGTVWHEWRSDGVVTHSKGGTGAASAAATFSGVAYVAGTRTTGLTATATKPWIKCNRSTGAATEEAGPPSFPFPDNEEWFEKSRTYGDIHVPGM